MQDAFEGDEMSPIGIPEKNTGEDPTYIDNPIYNTIEQRKSESPGIKKEGGNDTRMTKFSRISALSQPEGSHNKSDMESVLKSPKNNEPNFEEDL